MVEKNGKSAMMYSCLVKPSFMGELSKYRPLIQAQGQTIELKGWQVFLDGKVE